MNLQHMKYAVAVAETGSINKAADRLFVGQSNLSRAIKELENSLGVAIFERSAHGMELTPEGGVFLRYAKAILQQVYEVEHMFTEGSAKKKHFSISVPRSSYISEAFARFSCELSADEEFEVFYKETNAMRTLKNVLQDDYKLGILRYAENYDRYYKELVEEKGLRCELVAEFRYALLMSKDCPLAQQESITYEDLKNYIRVAYADPYVPSLPASEVRREELPDDINRRIYVFERASRFELLSRNPQAFMWVSPVSQELLERYSLVHRPCVDSRRRYKDVLIYRQDYTLSPLDKQFIAQLIATKRELPDNWDQ